VLLRWSVQHGVLVIPRSDRRDRIRLNAQIFDFAVGPEFARGRPALRHASESAAALELEDPPTGVAGFSRVELSSEDLLVAGGVPLGRQLALLEGP
jgi:hypothetical protein